MTIPNKSDNDAVADRLMKMLDVALAAVQVGDGDGALLALMEAEKVSSTLPIALPDRSTEAPERI